MSNEIMLNNYSDDAQIKKYISGVLMPRVFHDIPLNVLNTGHFSIINEYMSQAMEQLAYTSSFYFNESFITKAVLPDSIYAEAAIFNIGYSYAIPSSCNFLLELKIEDIFKNATINPKTGLYEFILDKNTKFNLSNGNVYSLDYDILVQYKSIETASRSAAVPAWNVQYINRDESNVVAKNKNDYIIYRVTDTWLCLFVQASEYERQTHIIVNNTMNGIPNADKTITCDNHIAGFDVKYIDKNGNGVFLPRDHILTMHSNVTDNDPYIHYIMDNPQTIRFMFQLNGNKYFIPEQNSSFEITIYTCHGESANFTGFSDEDQPKVITAANRYSNNGNVMKAAFVISPSVGGTNIGTVETVRRETIEAYNTANVISSDHDIDEWFKTFFFKNVLYPFFFKRRDDPWGRIWSAYLALKDSDDYIFPTNTLHGKIPYDVLYNNNDNTLSSNEIIIPPGWIWTYGNENRYTVTPYTKGDGVTIETAKTLASVNEKFVFANPFGIRIQKDPFAIGYFNPWINEFVTVSKISNLTLNTSQVVDNNKEDLSYIYHATPIMTNIKRTYQQDYYQLTTYISPTVSQWADGSQLVRYVRQNAAAPTFSDAMWNYFKQPMDLFSANIPILPLTDNDGYIPFNPNKTFLCVREKNRLDDNKWELVDIWIEDRSGVKPKIVYIPITGDVTMLYGDDATWGNKGLWNGYEVYASGNVDISIYDDSTLSKHNLQFERITTQNYYELRLSEEAVLGDVTRIVVGSASETELTKFGEEKLYRIGKSYSSNVDINVYFKDGTSELYSITNAANVYIPYPYKQEGGSYVFDLNDLDATSIILYADMKPSPESGAINYYRIPFGAIDENAAMFYIANKLLPVDQNNLRVLLHASINGNETGHAEMQPVRKESDGTILFSVNMQPLNELVDIDNRINIASINNGGGSWIPKHSNGTVGVDATKPDLKISILVRSEDKMRDSDIEIGDEYTGFRLVDQYSIDDISLVQELKEMRSVVNFGESSTPTKEQISLYNEMIALSEYDDTQPLGNIYTITQYAYNRMNGVIKTPYVTIRAIASNMREQIDAFTKTYVECVETTLPTSFTKFDEILEMLIKSDNGDSLNWNDVWRKMFDYKQMINNAFEYTNMNGGVEIQLVPMVKYSLMNSDRFESFVASFTQVHKAMEPVIMHRLEGNNYLDCKLIATYGLPHSYCADTDVELNGVFWPDLNVQIEFDVKLFDVSLTTNTLDELRTIIKSYFNRLTSIHTPVDMISTDNNIYISHIIQQMEEHPNVSYMKFVGWYTNEKNVVNGSYMDANIQSIKQKWVKLEDFPKKELERYTPEMFVLEDRNIVINIL